MTQLLKKNHEKIIIAALPIAFIGSVFFNCLTFVLDGHRHEWFRTGVTLGIQALALIIMLAELVQIWRKKSESHKIMLASLLVLVLYGIIMGIALLSRQDKMSILQDTITYGGYLVAYCASFLVIYFEQRLQDFLRSCRYYSIPMAGIVIFYIIRFYLPSAEYGVQNLGVYAAMPLAYGLTLFCIFLMLEMMLFLKPKTNAYRLDGLMYIIYAIGITLAASKGPMICLLFGSILLVIYAIKTGKPAKAAVYFPVSMIVCSVLFSTVLFPSYDVENRWITFLKELCAPQSVSMSVQDIRDTQEVLDKAEQDSTSEQEGETENVSDATEESKPQKDVVDFFQSGKADAALETGSITQEEYDTAFEMQNKLNHTASGGRLALWLSALTEIKDAPFFGKGPYFFYEKYGTYPHNFFLEIATDFGLPIMILILVLGIVVFLKLIKYSFQNIYVAVFTIYVLSYLPQRVISGSIYSADVFFQYGYCIIIAYMLCRKEKVDCIMKLDT